MTDMIKEFRDNRDDQHEEARCALESLKEHVDQKLNLITSGSSPGPGLNQQFWQDADRALVRYWEASGVVAILEDAQEDIPLPVDLTTEEDVRLDTLTYARPQTIRRKRKSRSGSTRESLNSGTESSIRFGDLPPEDQIQVAIAENPDVDVRQLLKDAQLLGDLTTASFQDRDLNYLRHEEVYRVELNRPYGPHMRIAYIEASNEADASEWFKSKDAKRKGVYVISVRRATEDDLEEYLETSV